MKFEILVDPKNGIKVFRVYLFFRKEIKCETRTCVLEPSGKRYTEAVYSKNGSSSVKNVEDARTLIQSYLKFKTKVTIIEYS